MSTLSGGIGLDLLGEIDLHYQDDGEPVTERKDGPLPYIGSGDGPVTGSRLAGRLRFSAFEDDGSGSSRLASEAGACALNLALDVETDNGARIRLDGLGYAVRDADGRWRSSLGARATSADPRYTWLLGRSIAWIGEFEEETGHGRAQLYVRRGE